MKKFILIGIYFFMLYILPFIATDIVYNFTNSTQFILGLFHVSGIVLCILIEKSLKWCCNPPPNSFSFESEANGNIFSKKLVTCT